MKIRYKLKFEFKLYFVQESRFRIRTLIVQVVRPEKLDKKCLWIEAESFSSASIRTYLLWSTYLRWPSVLQVSNSRFNFASEVKTQCIVLHFDLENSYLKLKTHASKSWSGMSQWALKVTITTAAYFVCSEDVAGQLYSYFIICSMLKQHSWLLHNFSSNISFCFFMKQF